MQNRNRKRMIFVLSAEIERKLRELAELKDLAMSDIVRRSVEMYYEEIIKEYKNEQQATNL